MNTILLNVCALFVVILHIYLINILRGFLKLVDENSRIDYKMQEALLAVMEKKIDEYHRDHSYGIETLHREVKTELLHIAAMIIQVPEKDREPPKKVHHRARTAEQKKASSIKRKEWWAKKREVEKNRAELIAELDATHEQLFRQQPVDPTRDV